MIKVLVADDDLDTHEVVHDILVINFRDVVIDKALNEESLKSKIKEAQPPYNLILFGVDSEEDKIMLTQFFAENPDLIDRTILLTETQATISNDPSLQSFAHLSKPFSLDHFGEIVKKTCALT